VAVRYSDFDEQGHVNNALYLTYFEQARIGYFDAVRRLARPALAGDELGGSARAAGTRDLQVPPASTDDRLELPLVLSNANCVYHRPIASLASLTVGVRAARIGQASLVLEYAIRSALRETLHATGSTTIVCVDRTTGRPRGLPRWALDAVRRLEHGE
jgi:acyl-CoA thioester hydrolase